MIVVAKPAARQNSRAASHEKFSALLPAIRQQARCAFRKARPECKEELVAEVTAAAFQMFKRLADRGRTDLAYATPLAQFAIRQVRSGRRVGTKCHIRDCMAPANRRVRVERLDRFDQEAGEWQEAVVEDRRAGPAETAAARLDFAAWLGSLSRPKRRIALALARGESTTSAARLFGLSLGRVSQLRHEFQQSWNVLQQQATVG